MTHLLTPDTLAALKARPSRPNQDDKPAWAARMNGDKWARAYSQASALLSEHIQDARHRDDGTETAAYLLSHALDLVAHGIVNFSDPGTPDPRKALRLAADEPLRIIWTGIDKAIKDIANETEAALQAQAQGQYNALLNEDRAELHLERDMLARTTDAALSEAAAAKQEAEVLRAQLKAEQQAHKKTRYDLQKQLDKARQPSSELLALRERVIDLERQLKAQPAPQLEVTEMPAPTLSLEFPSTLDAMAFAAYARQHQAPDAALQGTCTVTASVDLCRAHKRYQAEVRSPREYLRTLKSVKAVAA